METATFTKEMPGRWIRNTEGRETFCPNSLPRSLDWLGRVVGLVHDSAVRLGELKGSLREEEEFDPSLLLRPLAQREATLSSRIEGTVAAEEDLVLFDVSARVEEDVPDVKEVHNYLAAMEWGGEMVRGEEGREITVGLICELHQRLMDGVRGGDKTPGRLRERQVLIGGNGSYESAKFVPPSALHLRELLEDLCLFVREAREIPPLVRTAMAHYQFETIHPFNDGNGRVGRLLIGLEIVRDFGLPSPALHMSPYFEADRRAYYDGLLAVSQRGALADWTEYFLKGVVTQAEDAIARMGALRRLRREYRGKFEGKQSPEKTLRVIDQLFKNPAVTVRTVADGLQTSPKTAEAHIKRLIEAGLLVEVTGRNYGRVFIAREIVRVARESVKEPG